MKSTFSIGLLVSVLLGGLASPAWATVKVVTTTQDLASLTEAVGGSDVSVSYIARGDLDPHFIDAKPSFMVRLASADLVVAVGMELEVGWLPSLLNGARNPKIFQGTSGYLDTSTAIRPIEVPDGTIDRSRGDLHAQGNPHYWLNPENGRLMARAIETRLEGIDPGNAADYRANLATFEDRLTSEEAEWTERLASLRGTKVIGYHSTFDYFCDAYGMDIVGFVEPKPGIPPTASHTLSLAQDARSQGVRFVLVEPFHNPADAGPVASGSGAKVVVLPTSVGGLEGVSDYFGLFDRIVQILLG